MTPEEILSQLQRMFPHLDWEVRSSPNHSDEYYGRARDKHSIPILSIVHWSENSGIHSKRVDLWVFGSPRPQFRFIESALEWLEWFQEVMAK